MTGSRFHRNSSQNSGHTEGKTVPASNQKIIKHSHDNDIYDEQLLKSLQERLEVVHEKRLRRQIDLDNARKEIDNCKRQAKEMGINSLDELALHVQELEEKDRKALEDFIELLNEEEEILLKVENELNKLEQEDL